MRPLLPRLPRLALLPVAVLMLLAVPAARASDDAARPAPPGPNPGDWALQFEVVDNFRLSSFDGSALSLEHQTSERAAWRLGVGLGVRLGDRDLASASYTDSGSTGLPGRDEDLDSESLSLEWHFLRYPRVEGRVRPFGGIGPAVTFQRSSQTADRELPIGGSSHVRNRLRTIAAGVSFIVGAQAFVTRGIGVLAQYETHLSRIWTRQEQVQTVVSSGSLVAGEKDVLTDRTWELGQDAVRLGVSARFR